MTEQAQQINSMNTSEQSAIFRVLDAAANRGREAVRVIEDLIRFLCDDSTLTVTLKEFRHRFVDVLQVISPEARLAARSTESDVGTKITAKGEYTRTGFQQIITANFARLQESLRTIEECSKVNFPIISPQLERLRYDSYVLEQQVFFRIKEYTQLQGGNLRQERLQQSQLYLILDADVSDSLFVSLAKSGVDIIQLRDKHKTDREILSAGHRWKRLLEEISPSTVPPLLIMNDRPDLALLANFDGVHLGQTELPPTAVRQLVGQEMLLGLSTRTPEQVIFAMNEPIDYIGIGPVFPSTTKEFTSHLGPELVQQVMNLGVSFPVFAIGGIHLENIDSLLPTGCQRVAVSAAIAQAANPLAMVQLFKGKLIKFQAQGNST